MNAFNPSVSRVHVRAEYEVPNIPLGHIEFSISGDGAVAGLDRKSKYHDAPFVTPPMQSQIADHAFWRPIAIREASNRLAADFVRQVIPKGTDIVNGYLSTEFGRIPFSFGLVFFPSGETTKGAATFRDYALSGRLYALVERNRHSRLNSDDLKSRNELGLEKEILDALIPFFEKSLKEIVEKRDPVNGDEPANP
jgi:hypothetical protein